MSIRMVPQTVCDEPQCEDRGVASCARCNDDICLSHECNIDNRMLCCGCVRALRLWIHAGLPGR
jgi:hypothetical protein